MAVPRTRKNPKENTLKIIFQISFISATFWLYMPIFYQIHF